VVAWLNAAYQHTYQADYEQQDNPARSMEGLYQLLAFADAVGTTKGVLQACCSQLQLLQLHAQLGQTQVALLTDGTDYCFDSMSKRLRQQTNINADNSAVTGAPAAATAEEQRAFKQQVVAQTEQLLWLAYRLQLQPLAQRLQMFIRALSMFSTSLLAGGLVDSVITARVLEAAGVNNLPGGKQVLLNSISSEHVAFTEQLSVQTVLRPTGLAVSQQQPVKFTAVVRRTLLQLPQGATVPVELDIFGKSTIKIGRATFPCQLRIGSRFALT
jgi:hypothetical protein